MPETSTRPEVSRRQFLVTGAAAGGGLLLQFSWPLKRGAEAAGPQASLGAYIRIGADGAITIMAPNSEMGQGTRSALPQIVAEELMVDWGQVRVEQAPTDPAYANPLFHIQLTGGSTAVRGYHDSLRLAGATAREMLIAAAAQRFGVAPADCTAADGRVTVGATGQSATYGDLAADAALVPPPPNPPLVPRSRFRLIGKSLRRKDIPSKVNGRAVYGIDVRQPGMLHAAVRMCPTFGGTLGTYSSPPAGMTAVPLANGVAVVGPGTTWDAVRAARGLKVTWIDPPYAAGIETEAMRARAEDLMLAGQDVRVAKHTGDPVAAIEDAAHTVSATYSVPYLPHACMEPLNCTALVTKDACEIWAPTQGQAINVWTAARITGLAPAQIKVHTTFLGGGLGRKFEQDFVEQAVTVAKAVSGTPVKLTWTREDDFTHDHYRPAALSHFEAGLDADGRIVGLLNRVVSPSIGYQRGPGQAANPAWVDGSAVEGTTVDQAYAIPAQRVDWILDTIEVPVGYWRSVGHSYNAFFLESFIDELALAAGRDPVEFRRDLLPAGSRERAVLDAVAARSRWTSRPRAGRARGVALHASFGSIVGQVAEVSGSAGDVRVHRVTCVIDCGSTINPDTVVAQMESGIVHGLAAALWGEMTFAGGAATRRNFNSYRMMRMRDMPLIDVQIIESGGPLGGVGEPATPPIAPAVANAVARLTGVRQRTLPFVSGAGGGGGED
jgi:isoquinoline 1-oxidoreductase beta subunit